jgi:hypothetical protein
MIGEQSKDEQNAIDAIFTAACFALQGGEALFPIFLFGSWAKPMLLAN